MPLRETAELFGDVYHRIMNRNGVYYKNLSRVQFREGCRHLPSGGPIPWKIPEIQFEGGEI